MHGLAPFAPGPARAPWLNALVANIQDAIILVDSTGRVVFESASAAPLLGAAGVDGSGAFGIDRIHPEERDSVIRSFESTITQPGAVARATYRFQGVDGAWRHLEAVAKNLLHHPELRGVLITLRDVTERIRALEAAEEAGRAQEEFLSRMSHELRTPLHAILGWAQMLEAQDSPATHEAVEQIAAAGRHLLHLVDEALDVAAVREGRIVLDIRPVRVAPAAADAIEMIRPLGARRDVVIRIAGGSDPDTAVMADGSRLRQILINLVSNAVKYNRYAGEVEVDWVRSGTVVRIGVRDTGPGMTEEKLTRVFERFERLGMESVGIEGSGLGLSISRRLVQMMGGTIGVESTPGRGAEFWIRLPGALDYHPPADRAGGVGPVWPAQERRSIV